MCLCRADAREIFHRIGAQSTCVLYASPWVSSHWPAEKASGKRPMAKHTKHEYSVPILQQNSQAELRMETAFFS
jgi:hypothetical protein